MSFGSFSLLPWPNQTPHHAVCTDGKHSLKSLAKPGCFPCAHILLSSWYYHWRVPFSTASKKCEREKIFTTSLSSQLSPSLTDLNLKYNISNTWKSWAQFKVYSVLFVLWCFFSQTLCKNQGTTSALRSLRELLKTELLFKTRRKSLNPETLRKSIALFSEMVKFSTTPQQLKDFYYFEQYQTLVQTWVLCAVFIKTFTLWCLSCATALSTQQLHRSLIPIQFTKT